MGSSQSNLAIKLDLSGRGIKDLETDVKQPHMLPTFTKLQTISLKNNKLTGIPASIVNDLHKSPLVIEHLATLSLSKNRLPEVPDCIYLCSAPPSPTFHSNGFSPFSSGWIAEVSLDAMGANRELRNSPILSLLSSFPPPSTSLLLC